MIWLTPAAWFGITALVAPLAIHLLVHRRSKPFPFPTLQFLQPTRLASIRRRLVEDVALLIVRAAILVTAIAALAGPLVLTAARRAAWNDRVARAIVVDNGGAGDPERVRLAQEEARSAFRSTIIEVTDLGEGVRRAAAWLDEGPPARREIVCVSPLAIGAVTAADLSALPRDIGLKFVRVEELPATRTIAVAPVLTWADPRVGRAGADAGADLHVRARTATLNGAATLVADGGVASRMTLPLEVIAPDDQRPAVDAALSAVLGQRTLVPAPGRFARLLVAGAPGAARLVAEAAPIRQPWIGDAVARLARDEDVVHAAAEVRSINADAWLRQEPWEPIAFGADGRAVVAAAQSADRLFVVSAAPAADFLTPLLIRAILDALATPAGLRAAEIVPIPDRQLREWERPAALPSTRAPVRNVDDDRRWFWAAALGLIALESWMRRSRQAATELDAFEERADRVA